MEVISQEFKAIVQIVESLSIENSRKDLEITNHNEVEFQLLLRTIDMLEAI